jgi:hypothetical protein
MFGKMSLDAHQKTNHSTEVMIQKGLDLGGSVQQAYK